MEQVIQRLEMVKYLALKQQGKAVAVEPSVVAPDLYEEEQA
jgi:hypothetical protein